MYMMGGFCAHNVHWHFGAWGVNYPVSGSCDVFSQAISSSGVRYNRLFGYMFFILTGYLQFYLTGTGYFSVEKGLTSVHRHE